MFGTDTGAYDRKSRVYSMSDVILPPAPLSCPAPAVATAHSTPSTLISPASAINGCSMSIPESFASPFSLPSGSKTRRALQPQVDSQGSMLAAMPSGKPKPPQRPPACRECRSRKSKCDFELPCKTCMLHNTVDTCAYDKLAIPRRDRKAVSSRSTPAGGTTRTSQLKTLRDRLMDAEKIIVAQKATIQTQRESLDAFDRRSKLSNGRSRHVDGSGAVKSDQVPSGDSPIHQDSSNPAATLVEGLTHLVIHSAIAPSNESSKSTPPPSSSPPSSPPVLTSNAHSTSPTSGENPENTPASLELAASQDTSSLKADVLRLLVKHSGFACFSQMRLPGSGVGSRWLSSLGGFGNCVSRPGPTGTAEFGHKGRQITSSKSALESLPNLPERPLLLTHHPPTTILPSFISIRDPRDLLALFPPSFDQALRLLESYLGFVNQVHHLVDGEQARLELKLLYDSYIPNHRSTHESQSSVQINADKQPPMPVPELLEIGWLSGTLAIFVLGSNSDDQFELGDVRSLRRVWLKGALEGLAYRFEESNKNQGRPLDLSTLRCACLVVWIFVLYGKDEDIPPAINFNSLALYQACNHLQLHRDPLKVFPGISPRVAEDRRRVFYNMINTDWLFSAIIGKTYSPVSLEGHDVRIPSSLEGRDENSSAIDALGFRSLLMRQLRKLATIWIGTGMICEDRALAFENDLDRLDSDMPDWCAIDVENFQPSIYVEDPQANLTFSQQIITNVQLCAVRVRFHSKLAVPSSQAPQWVHDSASHHRKICIERAIRLLRLEQLHLTYTTRVLGHSGYPRFHPVVGGLTLSALMANSCDRAERNELFNELTRFTKFIQSCGTLSKVTNLGILAIETALAQVGEEDRLDHEASFLQPNHQMKPAALPQESRQEPAKCGPRNTTEQLRPLALLNDRISDNSTNPRDMSDTYSARAWASSGQGGMPPSRNDANPHSIDEFVSTWIVGPSPAIGITTSEAERGQLGGQRAGDDGLSWEIIRERYDENQRGVDTRSVNPDGMVHWAGSMIHGAMGERVRYGENIGSVVEGQSDSTLISTRQGDGDQNRTSHHHVDAGLSFKHSLPSGTSAPTFTPPHPLTIPDYVSNTPAFNRYNLNQPASAAPGAYLPSLNASSRSFGSGTPPLSAPAGSTFAPFGDPFWPYCLTSGPQSSVSTNFTSQLGFGGRVMTHKHVNNLEESEDSSEGVLGLSAGLSPSSYINSATSTAFSSNSYGLNSSGSSNSFSPWRQEW